MAVLPINVNRTRAQGTRKYIVDISGELPTIVLEINPASGSILKAYVHANSEILMQHDGQAYYPTAPRYFYLHDRLGSVREVIGTDGLVKNHYTYDAWGKIIATDGSVDNPFLFTGQYYDIEIGQYYLRARQYDPQLMRFISRDPVAGKFEEPLSLHAYLYCQNEPINRIDPAGLWHKTVHDKIINKAFDDFSLGYTEQMKRGSAYVDSPQFCDSEHAYMHAMRPMWTETISPSGYGPVQVTHVLSEQETLEKMVGFIMSEIGMYEAYEKWGAGYHMDAAFHLGEAAHPLMDFMCPAHTLRPWEGMPPEYIPHAVDFGWRMEDKELRDIAGFTRNTLDQLIGIHDALSGLY